MAARPTHSYVLRDTWMAVVFWIAVAAAVFLLGDTVLRGAWGAFAATAGIAGFVLWGLGMVLLRPHVRYDEERVVVTNIGRIHTIPWARVFGVQQQLNLAFKLQDGGVIRALGVTAPRDRGLVLGSLTRGKEGIGSGRFHDHADNLERFREQAGPSDEPVASRWDVRALVLGAIAAVAFVVDIAVLALG